MKRHLKRLFSPLAATAAALLIAGSTTATSQEQRTLEDVYNEAVKQYEAANYAEAVKGFQTVLKYQPNYVYARNYLTKCAEAMKQGGPKQTLEAQLAGLVIPSVNFEKTDLALVFQYLTQKSEELSGGKVVANFIYKGTDEEKKKATVTLSLRNTPFNDVVRYVGQLTNTTFKYEEFAIVAAPASAAPAVDPAATTQTTSLESKFDAPAQAPAPPVDPFSKR